MFKYFIKYNIYTNDNPPKEQTRTETTDKHMDEQGLKKILEARHGARVTLISWKETVEAVEE